VTQRKGPRRCDARALKAKTKIQRASLSATRRHIANHFFPNADAARSTPTEALVRFRIYVIRNGRAGGYSVARFDGCADHRPADRTARLLAARARIIATLPDRPAAREAVIEDVRAGERGGVWALLDRCTEGAWV
jgi:hypothetical protein